MYLFMTELREKYIVRMHYYHRLISIVMKSFNCECYLSELVCCWKQMTDKSRHHQYYCIVLSVKDRVGRSGCDLLWMHLNHNISLDI